jgi:hypothetical protein
MENKKFTQTELKQALNQLVDMMYEGNPTKRLVSSTPLVDPDIKKGFIKGKKSPFKSKAGNLVYPVDLNTVEDLLKEYKKLKTTNPTTIDIVEGILTYNAEALETTGEGVITEGHTYRINQMCDELNYEQYVFLVEQTS